MFSIEFEAFPVVLSNNMISLDNSPVHGLLVNIISQNSQKANTDLLNVAVGCPPLAPPSGGFLSTSAHIYNTTVEVTCDRAYYINGTTSLTCLADGHWSGQPAKCHGKSYTDG